MRAISRQGRTGTSNLDSNPDNGNLHLDIKGNLNALLWKERRDLSVKKENNSTMTRHPHSQRLLACMCIKCSTAIKVRLHNFSCKLKGQSTLQKCLLKNLAVTPSLTGPKIYVRKVLLLSGTLLHQRQSRVFWPGGCWPLEPMWKRIWESLHNFLRRALLQFQFLAHMYVRVSTPAYSTVHRHTLLF